MGILKRVLEPALNMVSAATGDAQDELANELGDEIYDFIEKTLPALALRTDNKIDDLAARQAQVALRKAVTRAYHRINAGGPDVE